MQAVVADFWIIGVDKNFLEELIDRRAKFGQCAHGTGEILDLNGGDGVLL